MVRFARLPLSPYQRDIWVAAAQFPELDQYTIFSYDRFTGEVDTQALERALLQAARDTEAFRLRLGETDGTPYQWLDTDAEFEARHVDLRADRDPEAAVRSWLRDAFRHAYPLDGRSLVDLALLHSDQALYVYVRTHHIVSDAWGLQLFLSRVRAGYLGELGEPQAQMPTASSWRNSRPTTTPVRNSTAATAPISPRPWRAWSRASSPAGARPGCAAPRATG